MSHITDKPNPLAVSTKRRGVRTGGDMLILIGAFGVPLPPAEKAMWDALSPEQREEAVRRLRVLLRFEGPRPPSVENASAEAGLSQNRWYEMYAAWRERRSLSSIGVAAATPRKRTLAYHNDLQRLVVQVADAEPKGSVRRLALALGETYGAETGVAEEDRPAYNTLRKFVEAELRRRSKEEEPGNDVVFDCCACELPHANGFYAAFLVIDRASHIVLGAALGEAADSRAGYALASKDALNRIGCAPINRLAWAEELARSELVIGLDAHAWVDHEREMAAAGLKGQLQPATKARRFGAYVRPLIGLRMGRLKFVPGRTSKEQVFAVPTADDATRFGVEIDVYNADLVPGGAGEGRAPPAKLLTLLKKMSKR